MLRAETGDPLHLVGHSFGGLVTRAAVLAEPALFTSLTLLGSGPAKLSGRRADLLDHLGRCSTPAACSWCTRRSSRWR